MLPVVFFLFMVSHTAAGAAAD